MSASSLTRLIRLLSRLPGIGERTATRLAFYLLRASDGYVEELAQALIAVKRTMRTCSICCHLTEEDPCAICRDARRDSRVIMVLGTPQDLLAVERSGIFRGRYHVLHGLLSPLDGIGPDELKIQPLIQRVGKEPVTELILATSPNVEGDATALYLAKLFKPLVPHITRIASGVPIGGELEFSDGVTLTRAIEERREF